MRYVAELVGNCEANASSLVFATTPKYGVAFLFDVAGAGTSYLTKCADLNSGFFNSLQIAVARSAFDACVTVVDGADVPSRKFQTHSSLKGFTSSFDTFANVAFSYGLRLFVTTAIDCGASVNSDAVALSLEALDNIIS